MIDNIMINGLYEDARRYKIQEVKQRIAMAKQAFNRKKKHFLRTLAKRTTEETSEVFCVECSVVWCRDLDTRRNEPKRLEAFEMRGWRRMESVKWTDKIKYVVVLERGGEGRIMLELIKKRKRNWLGHWLRRKCVLKDVLKGMVNGKEVGRRRRYQMIDNFMINGLYEDTKRKAEKRVERRRLSLQ